MALLSKAEKRLALKALKEDARLLKQARSVVEPSAPSIPEVPNEPIAVKDVRVAENPKDILGRRMRWNIERADRAETWSWGHPREWGDDVWADDLQPKLVSFSSMTWREIHEVRHKGKNKKYRQSHHDMAIGKLCDEAQARAAEIELTQDVVFSFRCGSKKRMWGYRLEEYFFLIWWDPKHKIYPTAKS